MAGLLVPYEAERLVKELKKAVKVPIQLHTHYTSGVASMTYLKAIEAGVDVVDCALSPLALGTSQPATETIVKTLEGSEFDTGINIDALTDLADYFKPMREEYLASGLLNTKMLGIDINTLKYQVPGGMLSNLVSQLKQQNAEDKFEDVLKEIPKVREDLGWIPLVTPTSQIVGTQAVLNVLMGERYKMTTKETKGIVRGEYGRTPVEIKDEIVKKIIGDEERITCRPADNLKPELEDTKNKMKEYLEQDEDILSYALFDQVAVKFFEQRRAEKYKIDKDLVNMDEMTHPV